MQKIERLFAIALVALVSLTLPAVPSQAGGGDGDYYYNAGRRMPLVRSATRVAIVGGAASARVQTLERARTTSAIRAARDIKACGVVELTVSNTREVATEVRDLARSAGARIVPVFHEPGAERDESTLFIADEILVRFRPEVSLDAITALAARHGAEAVEPLRYAQNGFRLRVSGSDLERNALTVANAFYESGLCLWAHPNFLASRSVRFVPNDTRYPNQWHLNNTGQFDGTPGADVKAQAAWDVTLGSTSISVAVADTGIDWHHEDLAVTVDGVAKIHSPRDVVHGDDDPYPQPTDANTTHGSSCAGVAVMASNNTVGGSGIAPKCRLVPIQLYAESTFTPNATEADAFTWAADHADIMSNSWGPDFPHTPLPDATRNAIDYATTNGRGGKGTVVLFAAGNSNSNIDATNQNGVPNDPYCSYDGVIAVAASTNFDTKAGYSCFGPSVSICAPSSGGSRGINTTGFNGTNNGYTTGFGGTSSACPLAAGIAALVLSVNPNLTWRQVKRVLEQSADKIDVGSAFGQYDAQGYSIYYGYGRVNAHRAVRLARAGGPDSPGIYANGTFFLRNTNSSGQANANFGFGQTPGYTPIAGDWDGDGVDTIGVYHAASRTFFLRDSNDAGNANHQFTFGPVGAIPVVGDWNNDGTDTIGVYVQSTGVFFLKDDNGPGTATYSFRFGPMMSTLLPVTGDWNGDGVVTVGLYNLSTGTFALRNEHAGGVADATFRFGSGGRLPIAGDWDNDGTDSIGLYDTGTGAIFVKNLNAPGAADWTFSFGSGGATPLVGDWDGQ